MIPELKIKIDCETQCIELYEYEHKSLRMEVKNLTNEAKVTSFSLTCADAEVVLPEDMVEKVVGMDCERSVTYIVIEFVALPGMKKLHFVCQYSGQDPTCLITVTESVTLSVKPGLEVQSISLKPRFNYDYFSDLKRWDPSLGTSRGLFPLSEEDDGVTDSEYCQLIVVMNNSMSETVTVEATLSNPSHVVAQVVGMREGQEQRVVMEMEKGEESAQEVVEKRLRVTWKAGDRRGGIGPIRINPLEGIHIQPPSVHFHYECGPVLLHEFCKFTVKVTTQVRLKSHYIYLYRYKEVRNGRINLKPEQLVLSGSLSAPFPEDGWEGELSVKFCAVEEGDYGFIAACGPIKRIAYWASECYRIQPRRLPFRLP